MKLQPYPTELLAIRPDILRAKHTYGIWFGVAVGLTFSIFAWGIDAFLLDRMNGLLPWLKFLGGVIPSMAVGGLAGWLSARLEKPIFSLIVWGVAATLFAWLTIGLPLILTPRILSLAEPGIADLLHYVDDEAASLRFGVAYIWLAIFVSLVGLLQIPLSDSAVFSTSLFGNISPMLITLGLMAICGTIMDSMNNELLRSSIDSVNSTVQFALENRGQKVDPAVSRRMHLGALRSVADVVTPERKFIVSGYDHVLEQVQVLARFEEAWVECELISNQLVSCEQVRAPG
jgi:hypothetical protein